MDHVFYRIIQTQQSAIPAALVSLLRILVGNVLMQLVRTFNARLCKISGKRFNAPGQPPRYNIVLRSNRFPEKTNILYYSRNHKQRMFIQREIIIRVLLQQEVIRTYIYFSYIPTYSIRTRMACGKRLTPPQRFCSTNSEN